MLSPALAQHEIDARKKTGRVSSGRALRGRSHEDQAGEGEDPIADQARQLRQEADADKQTFAALREMFLAVQGSGKDHSHRQWFFLMAANLERVCAVEQLYTLKVEAAALVNYPVEPAGKHGLGPILAAYGLPLRRRIER